MTTKDYVVSFDRFSYVNENYGSAEFEAEQNEDIYEDDEFDGEESNYQFESLIDEIDEIRENMVEEFEYSFVNEGIDANDSDLVAVRLLTNLVYENSYNLPFIESVIEHIDEAIDEMNEGIYEATRAATTTGGGAGDTGSSATGFTRGTAAKRKFAQKSMQKIKNAAKAIGSKLKQAITWLKKKFSIAKMKAYGVYKKDLKAAGDDVNRKNAAKAKYDAAIKKINDEYKAKIAKHQSDYSRRTAGKGKGPKFGSPKFSA